LGGASRSAGGDLIALGGLAMVGAALSVLLAMRRRQVHQSRDTDGE
jgi:hypothetical protein